MIVGSLVVVAGLDTNGRERKSARVRISQRTCQTSRSSARIVAAIPIMLVPPQDPLSLILS